MALTQEQRSSLETIAAVPNPSIGFLEDDNGLDAVDRGLIAKLAPAIQEQFSDLNMSPAQANEHTRNFLKLFDNDSSKAAEFILKADTPDIEKLMQSAKTPAEALNITQGLVQASNQGDINAYARAQLTEQQKQASANAGEIPETIRRPDTNTTPAPAEPSILEGIAEIATGTKQQQAAPEIQVPYRAPETPQNSPPEQQPPSNTVNSDPAISEEDLLARNEIAQFLAEHVEANPADKQLAAHFMEGVANDPKLQEALKIWKSNNADILSGEGSESMIGDFDKDRMVHDLLQGYKDDKEKVYATLQSDNFQMNAFMQYSDMGKMLGFLIEPILEWIGKLFGQDSDLAGFANMNLDQWFADFQDLLGDGTNNLLAMGNNLDFGQRVGGLFNVVVGAAQDAGNMTSMDRYYRDQESPAVSITHVDSNNSITGTSTFGAGMALPGQSAADLAAEEQRKQQQALANQQNLNAANNSPTPVTGAPGT